MSDEHVSQAILDSLPGLAQEARHMRLTRGLQEARLAAQAGVLGEPALDIPLDKLIFTTVPADGTETIRKCLLRYDDLIALIKEQNGAGE